LLKVKKKKEMLKLKLILPISAQVTLTVKITSMPLRQSGILLMNNQKVLNP